MRIAIISFFLIALTGCSNTRNRGGPVITEDAGENGDAGMEVDSGASEEDSGVVTADAGDPAVDSGMHVDDAGTTPDSGTVPCPGTGSFGCLDQEYALAFESAQRDRVIVSSPPTLGTGAFTLEAWINVADGGGNFPTIFSRRSPSNPQSGFLFAISNYASGGSGNLLYQQNGHNVSLPSGTINLSGGVWHHVALVRAATTVTFYVDGTAVGSGAIDPNINVDGSPLLIGADANADTVGNAFDGMIHNVVIWNVARTADQIEASFMGLETVGAPALRFRMNEGTGTSLRSDSGTGIGALGSTHARDVIAIDAPTWVSVH